MVAAQQPQRARLRAPQNRLQAWVVAARVQQHGLEQLAIAAIQVPAASQRRCSGAGSRSELVVATGHLPQALGRENP